VYICICNSVTDRQIRDAVNQHGARRIGHLKKQLGACTQCGKCAAAAQQVLDDCLTAKRNQTKGINLPTAAAFQCG